MRFQTNHGFITNQLLEKTPIPNHRSPRKFKKRRCRLVCWIRWCSFFNSSSFSAELIRRDSSLFSEVRIDSADSSLFARQISSLIWKFGSELIRQTSRSFGEGGDDTARPDLALAVCCKTQCLLVFSNIGHDIRAYSARIRAYSADFAE